MKYNIKKRKKKRKKNASKLFYLGKRSEPCVFTRPNRRACSQAIFGEKFRKQKIYMFLLVLEISFLAISILTHC